MKVEPFPASESASDLQDLVRWYRNASPGTTVRISDLPPDYIASSCERLYGALSAAILGHTGELVPDLDVQRGDRFRTPQSYLLTKKETRS